MTITAVKPIPKRIETLGMRLTETEMEQFRSVASQMGYRPGTLARELLMEWLSDQCD